jgi:DnaK suppressor protein
MSDHGCLADFDSAVTLTRQKQGCLTFGVADNRRNKGGPAMDDSTYDESRYRAKIDAEIAELHALSDASRDARAPVELDQQSVGRLSRMDAMQQQSMDLAREERRRTRLAILAAALRRMDDGDYGYCLACGEGISAARLDVDPAVTLCVECRK